MQKYKIGAKLFLLVSVVVLISLFLCGFMSAGRTATVHAAAEILEGEIEPEDGIIEADEPADTVEGESYPTFLSRVEEWFKRNLAEFLSGTTLATILGAGLAFLVSSRRNRKLKAATDALLAGVELKTANNTESNGEVIKAINALIAKYNEVQDYISQIDTKELARDALCNEMATYGRALLEILATVYANNQNLPQGIKDLVTLKYANALKAGGASAEEVDKEG